jgi:hypothetical protein
MSPVEVCLRALHRGCTKTHAFNVNYGAIILGLSETQFLSTSSFLSTCGLGRRATLHSDS